MENQEHNLAELKLEKAIDERLDEVVLLAENRVKNSQMVSSGISKSQLNSALVAATETNSSPLSIKNWLLYQAGRDKAKWDMPIVKAIAEDLEKLKEIAGKLAEKVTGISVENIHVRLIRIYLGYLKRSYIYEFKVWKEGNNRGGRRV